jgi:hypothetical protein
MEKRIEQPTASETATEGSKNRYTAADYRRFIGEQERRADEAPTAHSRQVAELRAEAYRRQLADAVALEAASDGVAL